MMKHIILIAMLLALGGTASATMWLYNNDFFMLATEPSASTFKPAAISPFEIINAPFFPLLGEGFYKNPIPMVLRNATGSVEISRSGNLPAVPILPTFSGHMEDNLKYAQSKSSIRIGESSSWSGLSFPGLV